jgi:WD40 repeat protein
VFGLLLIGLALNASSSSLAQGLHFEIVPNIGHSGGASAFAFSPNGQLMVSGGYDAALKLWEVRTGRLVRSIDVRASVNAVAFSPDGRHAISGSTDGAVKLWEVESGRLVRKFSNSQDWILSVSFSRDGAKIVSGSKSGTTLWDAKTGRLLRSFPSQAVGAVKISSDGQRVFSITQGFIAWDVQTGKRLRMFSPPGEQVELNSISSDGRRLLAKGFQCRSEGRGRSCSAERLELWNTDTQQLVMSEPIESDSDPGWNGAFSPDRRYLLIGATSSNPTLKLWDVETGRLIRTVQRSKLSGFGDPVFSPDGRYVLATDEAAINLWDVETGALVRRFEEQSSDFFPVAISRDGRRLVSGTSAHSKLKLWDLDTGQYVRELGGSTDAATSVAISAGAQLVASGSKEKVFRVWNAQTGQLLHTSQEQEGSVLSVAFSPDGKKLLSASGGETKSAIKLWDVPTFRLLKTLVSEGDEDSIRHAMFSPDGRRVIARNRSLWDLDTGQVVRKFQPDSPPTYTVQFSSDGKRLATGDHGGEFQLFDVSNGRMIRAFFHDAGVSHPVVQRLAFSPDGRRLLSAIRNAAASTGDVNLDVNAIKLWDPDTGRLIGNLVGHKDQVVALAFSPDGRRIISASIDRIIRIWDANNGSTLGTTIVARNGEWITVTPEGFFSASANGAQMLNVVRGLDVYSIALFYQSLYRPDLVREKLSGDLQGRVKEAASRLDLAKVLASGSEARSRQGQGQ